MNVMKERNVTSRLVHVYFAQPASSVITTHVYLVKPANSPLQPALVNARTVRLGSSAKLVP